MKSFKDYITEARDIIDIRHRDFRDDPGVDPWIKKWQYIDPKQGFYWTYSDTTLLLASSDNGFLSGGLYYAERANEVPREGDDVRRMMDVSKRSLNKFWNQLGGLVDFTSKTVTINKESVGNKYRQRSLTNTKELQQALASLKKYGITDDYKLKGAPVHIPNTVGKALALTDTLEDLLDPTKNITMYHGTSESRWKVIQRRGLLPRASDSERESKDDVYYDLIPNYSEYNIYLATTKKVADFYAKRQSKKDGSAPIILKIEIIDKSKLIPDDRYVNKLNPITTTHGFKESSKVEGEFAYKGFILPKFIKKA